jgi:uncharacterized protein
LKIAYVDSSIVVRYYLPDDPGFAEAVALIDDPDTAIVSSTLTRIESTGALVRAAKAGRVEPTSAVARFEADLALGTITLVALDHDDVERIALDVVRAYGIRALDALHIAAASLALPMLANSTDTTSFVTRDSDQARAAAGYGLAVQ